MKYEELKNELEKVENEYREVSAASDVYEEPNWNEMMNAEPDRIDEFDKMMQEWERPGFEEQLEAIKYKYFQLQYDYIRDLLVSLKLISKHNFPSGNGNSFYYETSIGKIRFSDHSQLYDADINISYDTLGSNKINDDGMDLEDATTYLTKKAKEYFESED